MKKSKIIIPALGLIALGTAASITGTVAWFSMNNTVTATGMQVAVKSNSTFLLIGSGDADTASEIQTAGTITTALTVSAGESQVLPVAHDAITNTASATSIEVSNLHHYKLTDGDDTITIDQYNALDVGDQGDYTPINQNGTNWYYRIADTVSESDSTKQKNYLATLDSSYIIHKICYVTVAAGANNATNLKVSNSTWTNQALSGSIAATKCLITSSGAAVELSPATRSSETVLAATVTDANVVQLDVFIYYDGNHADVYTNNRLNLSAATLELEFSATAAA